MSLTDGVSDAVNVADVLAVSAPPDAVQATVDASGRNAIAGRFVKESSEDNSPGTYRGIGTRADAEVLAAATPDGGISEAPAAAPTPATNARRVTPRSTSLMSTLPAVGNPRTVRLPRVRRNGWRASR